MHRHHIMNPSSDLVAKMDCFTVKYDEKRADDLRRYQHLRWISTVMVDDEVLSRVFDSHPTLLANVRKRMEALRISLGFQS